MEGSKSEVQAAAPVSGSSSGGTGSEDLKSPLSSSTGSRAEIQRFYSQSRSEDERVCIEFKNIEYSTLVVDKVRSSFFKQVFNEKKILRGVSGKIESGSLLAIMGATGCGKTSLLNVLAARIPSGGSPLCQLTGTVLVNGSPRNDDKFRAISAYVQQDDLMYAHLTVRETLTLAAQFYLPNDTPLESKLHIVETLLADLGLLKCADTRIGNDKVRGVSGGERKRSSIAVQLISDPAVLFLDEPTSGLDAFQAQSVMDSMKNLAELGRMVISVIHQPRSSIFQMFDKLMLLSEGRTMYFGDSLKAVDHFAVLGYMCPESFNPSDFFLDVLSPDNRFEDSEIESANRIKHIGDVWEIEFKNKIEPEDKAAVVFSKEVKAIGSEFSLTKIARNFVLLCWRAWSEQSRDVVTLVFKVVIMSLFALLLGGIYSRLGNRQTSIQNRSGLLFFVSIQGAFTSITSVLNIFPREKVIVNRERSGRAYNTFSYFVAKFFMEIPLTVIPALIYCCVLFWLAGLNPTTFGYFVLIFMLEALTAVALGLAVSAVAPSVEAASAMGTPLVIIGILFGGFYITIDSLPIVANWIPYFSFIRWTFQAFCINEFQGLKFECGGITNSKACITTGEQVLENLGFDGHTTAYPVFGLGMLLLGFLSLTYMAIDFNRITYISLGHKGGKYMAHIQQNSRSDNASAGAASLSYSLAPTSDEPTSELELTAPVERTI